ncbi:hypothetical protein FEE95_06280 [Maribacter algarum]|uniref:DUF1801 domain-containing protein n=1 Tax=Maribacter algarum (ex Zhang et al. 2020) TaxID=2578118 RepID=A0A5S3Q0C7_9FLAO|nr:hypothetical protein [Maribacter algarum]TMM59037.1 hypothetical protein FEE95_06280 [Maribacter algarum]
MTNSKLFDKLKSLLKIYEPQLSVVHDKPTNYYLNTAANEKNKKGEFFAAVQVKKNYIAFHLMPVYYYPDLLSTIGDDLKKRMQGKSCFNFNQVEDELFDELSKIITLSFNQYIEFGRISLK